MAETEVKPAAAAEAAQIYSSFLFAHSSLLLEPSQLAGPEISVESLQYTGPHIIYVYCISLANNNNNNNNNNTLTSSFQFEFP